MGTAEQVHIAVASNFLNPLKEIAKQFERNTKNRLILISASTGKLYAQALHGAPFDVLLAADEKRPALLEKKGLGVPGTRFTYAVGTLVLWSADPERVKEEKSISMIKTAKLAIANPKTAPYGKAAQEILEKLNLWEKIKSNLVQGENIAQTLQFVATGNAELGFIAKSQIQDPRFKLKGSRWEVPLKFYKPISQQAILLKPGKDNSEAKKFMNYLKGPVSKKIMTSYGYQF